MEEISVSFPIMIMKEGDWYVASCPQLDIATQGKTEEEVKENIADLIDEYIHDPDLPHPTLKTELSSLSFIRLHVPKREGLYGEASTA